MSDDIIQNRNENPQETSSHKRSTANMRCDVDDYCKHLKDLALTPEQEAELLYTLWDMMRMFVEIGYGVDAINKIFPSIFENEGNSNQDLSE
jgi:hypothetical protein